jgi:hypothetical protein
MGRKKAYFYKNFGRTYSRKKYRIIWEYEYHIDVFVSNSALTPSVTMDTNSRYPNNNVIGQRTTVAKKAAWILGILVNVDCYNSVTW